MSHLDLISLMVEETFSEKVKVFSLEKDLNRCCFILNLNEKNKIEIPFGFGPFKDEASSIFLGSEDSYLYPHLNRILEIEAALYEFSFDENLIYLHLELPSMKFAA